MTPDAQRLLMMVLGVACLAAAKFLPEQRELLLATGVGLIGWAKKAPGHNGGPPTAGGIANAAAVALFAASLAGCASRPDAAPCDEATLASLIVDCSARVRQCPKEGECPAEDECSQRLDEREALCLRR